MALKLEKAIGNWEHERSMKLCSVLEKELNTVFKIIDEMRKNKERSERDSAQKNNTTIKQKQQLFQEISKTRTNDIEKIAAVTEKVRNEQKESAAKQLSQPSHKSFHKSKNPKKILIVEDNEINATLLKNTLGENYIASIAKNWDETLDFFNTEKPDAILMDVFLGEENGLELCRLIKKDPGLRSIPIIVITAAVNKMTREEAFEAGADEFVQIPYNLNDLVGIIESFKNGSKQAAHTVWRHRAEANATS